MNRLRLLPGLAVVLMALGGLAGCGSDDDASAEAKVCDARSDVSSAIDTVVSDLKSANLGMAREHFDDVKTAAADLKTAVGDLRSERREEIQPEVDQLDSDLQAVSDATTLSELQTSLSAAQTSFQGLVSAIDTSLDCD